MSAENVRVAAVTGGSGGIGRAIAMRLARGGALVEIASRNEAEGQVTVQMVEAEGGSAHFTAVDVTSPEQVEAWIADVHGRNGRLDWLVNNAGITGDRARIDELSPSEVRRIVDTNLLSVCFTTRAAVPLMRAQGSGAIVNLGSTASIQGYGMMAMYSATKHAVLGFTRATAMENADVPIRINCVCPGMVDTEMMRQVELVVDPGDPASAATALAATVPLQRYATPMDVANSVHFLLADESAYITGTSLAIDGGVTSGVSQ